MDTNADYIKQYKSVFPIGITDSLHELIAQLGIGSLHTRICPDLLTPLRIHYSIWTWGPTGDSYLPWKLDVSRHDIIEHY